MDAWWIAPVALAGGLVGVLASLGWARAAARAAETRLREQVAGLEATLEAERRGAREQRALLDGSRQALSETFRALSADVLQANSRQFLDLARTQLEGAQARARAESDGRSQAFAQALQPLGESLAQVQARLRELEQARVGAYEGLREQVANLLSEQRALRGETRNLVGALRQPTVRGRWGEIQLRRVVELAGMLPHCDFVEQQSVVAEDGRLRPDLIVRLPGGGVVVVDAKVPLQAYLDALEAPDEAGRAQRLAEHARHLRGHVAQLARRGYAEGLRDSAPFVVLFVPGDVFFNAALEQDPALLEAGVEEGVLIATPTSLIALLRAVAQGWRQEQLARNAAAIGELGRELHSRLATLTEHWAAVGKNLRQAVEGYNRATGSLEARVMVTARRFEALDPGLRSDSLPVLDPVQALPRSPAQDPAPPAEPKP